MKHSYLAVFDYSTERRKFALNNEMNLPMNNGRVKHNGTAEKRKKLELSFISASLVTCLCIVAIVLTGAATTLYGDDFDYALYFRNGLSEFLKMTAEHYMYTNGRAVVHFILESVLVFRDKLFFIVIPLLVFLVYFFASRALSVKSRILFLAFSLSATLVLPYTVLREGVFWMAGAINYIYPTMLVFAAFYLFKRSANEERIGVLTLLVLFLAGASTEQGGAAVIAATVLYTAVRFKNMKSVKISFVMILIMLIGYATVVLSPATFGRAVSEISEQLTFAERLRLLYNVSVGKNSAFVVFEGAILLLAADEFRRHKLFSVLLAVAAVVSIVLIASEVYFAAGIILTLAFVSEGLVGLFSGNAERSALLLSGLMSVGMLVFSVSFGYRNILPCLMTLIAVSSDILCELVPKGRKSVITLVAVFAVGVVSFAPVFFGYAENRKIINENLSALGDGTSDFYYNIDLDPRYSYNQFVSGGYRSAYRRVYNICDEVKIYIKGSRFRDLYQNGVHCENPVYITDGEEYYPLRNVIEAEGGVVAYNKETRMTEISVNGKKVVFDNIKNIFNNNGVEIDATEYRLVDREYGKMFVETVYFKAELFKTVFDIDAGK